MFKPYQPQDHCINDIEVETDLNSYCTMQHKSVYP